MVTTGSVHRVVLDTNVVLSALVFGRGSPGTLRLAWQKREFVPLVSKSTAEELIRVLAYPKFQLDGSEREDLLADYLPYCEVVQVPLPGPPTPSCRDPFDIPFLELSLAGRAGFLVTGDGDLLSLASAFSCPIVTPERFLAHIDAS